MSGDVSVPHGTSHTSPHICFWLIPRGVNSDQVPIDSIYYHCPLDCYILHLPLLSPSPLPPLLTSQSPTSISRNSTVSSITHPPSPESAPQITTTQRRPNDYISTTPKRHIELATRRTFSSTIHMVIWLERHSIYVEWLTSLSTHPTPAPPPAPVRNQLQLTKQPTANAVSAEILASAYHAFNFRTTLATFLNRLAPPTSSPHSATFITVLDALGTLSINVPVWHRIQILNSKSTQDIKGISDRTDAIHVEPARKNKAGAMLDERFDTALIDEKRVAKDTGIEGTLMVHTASPW